MIEDFHAGKLFFREISTRGELSGFIRARQPRVITYEDWKKIDAAEITKGAAENRLRIKFTNVEEMLSIFGP